MFKKGFISCLLAAALLVTLGGAALADHEETAPARETVQEPIRDYAPGTVPAQTGAVQSMSPAIHGVVLAMLHHGADEFQADDTALAWESLYNMLSLYGQLDERSEYQDSDHLLLLSETVRDYTAALDVSFDELGPLPGALSDRIVYDAAADSYQVVCGNDSQAQFQVYTAEQTAGGLVLEGALVSLTDQTDLARFEAALQPRDSMFGYAITALTLT